MFASDSVTEVEKAPPNGYHQHLSPQEESQLCPACLRSSPRSASGSETSSFQSTSSGLGLRACETLCEPLRVEAVFYRSPALPYTSSVASLKSRDILEVCLPVEGSHTGEPNLGLELLIP